MFKQEAPTDSVKLEQREEGKKEKPLERKKDRKRQHKPTAERTDK